jgi:TonB-linked SusC/RagA family outer membrane protein
MRLLFLVLFISSLAFAQNTQRNISGIVLDSQTQEPILGATILVKGTSKGAATGLDGKFSYTLKAADVSKSVLVISYVGYISQEITVGSSSFFTIDLIADIESLGEVIITSSYGTKKLKEEVVGSIVTIRPEELGTEQPATSIDELLVGQVAGVDIIGNPNLGEPVTINIRGQGSLTPLNNNQVGTSTQPLIIVDGIILTEEVGIDGNNFFDSGDGGLSENFLNSLSRVGVQDIESINVLKDAAAVGFYGANAANGVILITTKTGKAGKVVYNANFQGGITQAYDGIKYMNGRQFNELRNLYNTNNGQLNNVREWNGVDTNWFELLNQTAVFQRYSFGASGGFKDFRFRGSATYQKRQEAQISNTFDQINTSIAADYSKNNFSASLRLSPSFIEKNNPNTLYNFAIDPTLPVRDENGSFTRIDTFGNPLAVSEQNKSLSETFALLASLRLSYEFNENFTVNTLYGTDYSLKDEDRFFSALNGSGIFNPRSLPGSDDLVNRFGRRLLRERDTWSWNWSATANFNKDFDKNHHFDAAVGIETRGEKTDFSYINATGFETGFFIEPVENALFIDRRADTSENYSRSVFSQYNYDFQKTYFLLVNFRVDQSSAFGDDNQTALNGGAGVSWVISKEKFLSENNFIDFLRLRSSYGSTGNSRIGSYRSLGLYNLGDSGGYNGGFFANPTGDAPNPELGWERNNKFNLGIDFNFLGRFSTTLEVFRDNISDQIVSRPVIPESGYANIQINGASSYNQGIEFSLQAKWLNGPDFKWSSSFNIATLDSKITSLSGLSSDFSSRELARSQQIGNSSSAIYGFRSLGIDPATGLELFRVNGQTYTGRQVSATFNNVNWEVLGDSQADFYGGLRNSLSYKGFDIQIITSFTYGGDVLLDREIVDQYRVITNRNLNVNAFYDAWRNAGDLARSPAVTDSNTIISNSSRYLYDASSFSLRSITLSYDLPVKKWNFPLNNLRVNFNGSNLYEWFSEGRSSDRNNVAQLRNTYPQQRTYSLGINTTF